MATNKNIQMKQYNGTDYDNLYPTPSAHAASHKTGGTDALTASDISVSDAGGYFDSTTVEEVLQEIGSAQIKTETTTYTGTGTYGYSNPTSITASFPIKIAIIRAQSTIPDNFIGLFVNPKKTHSPTDHSYSSDSYYNSSSFYRRFWASSDGKTLHWYASSGSSDEQLNKSGRVYDVLMIGWD